MTMTIMRKASTVIVALLVVVFPTSVAFLASQANNQAVRVPSLLAERHDSTVNDNDRVVPTKKQQKGQQRYLDRRSLLFNGISITAAAGITQIPTPANAEITKDSMWPLWLALPVAPYSRRRTIRREIAPGVWTFDQLIGIYYVHVPIRMTVVAINNNDDSNRNGLLVYAPVAPTKECLLLLDELIQVHGAIRYIILPSVAVEHKVNAGPFARQFPNADFFVTDRQYSFPITLPKEFLGLPRWTKPLPASNNQDNPIFGPDIDFKVLTVKPGPGSQFQDVALLHKPSETLLICDSLFATGADPPPILTDEPEYTRALLFHARDSKEELVDDTPENRRKGWRRIVLLFNFFFPGSGKGNLGLGPIGEALQTPNYKYGWGGWMPFTWNSESELIDFERFSNGGKPTILPIIQIILARGPDAVKEWVKVVSTWKFRRVIPAHLDAPLAIGPKEFAATYDFINKPGSNEVRFCDEDVEFLRAAEEGPLSFSVYDTPLGVLRGKDGKCGLTRGPNKNRANQQV